MSSEHHDKAADAGLNSGVQAQDTAGLKDVEAVAEADSLSTSTGTPVSARPVRSFVLRQGRMSAAQTRFLQEQMPRVGIPYQASPVDFTRAFGRSAPLIVEVGFGMGHTTAEIAGANPDNNYLGIEVHAPGVGSLCKSIVEQELSNLRIVQHDAVEVLQKMISPASLAGVHVFFPDPWPKKRHHKRRLIQPGFVKLLASRIAPGGYLHCATDWEEYAQQMLEVLNAESALANTADGYAPRPAHRPLTRFEQRGLRLGHGVWDLMFARRS